MPKTFKNEAVKEKAARLNLPLKMCKNCKKDIK